MPISQVMSVIRDGGTGRDRFMNHFPKFYISAFNTSGEMSTDWEKQCTCYRQQSGISIGQYVQI